MSYDYDLVVIGAGSGGCSTSISAARQGLRVLLVEAHSQIGGTAAWAGVNNWASGAGGTGLPFEIYCRLVRIPHAVGITSFDRHICWPDRDERPTFPGGEMLIDPRRTYLDTLRRHGATSLRDDETFVREHWHNVSFEPDIYARVVVAMLAEAGTCVVLRNTTIDDVRVTDDHIDALRLSTGQWVTSRFFADCTGQMCLAEAAGCRLMTGQEAGDVFAEPSAPDHANSRLNAATLIYRVSPKAHTGVDPLAAHIPDKCWWAHKFTVASVDQYPNGDLNINMMPTMDGCEVWEMGIERAWQECQRRVLAHWHHWQRNFEEFTQYALTWIAPLVGIRDSNRVVGRYVLTELDVRAGLSHQNHPDVIAVADHALDTHGQSTGRSECNELKQPYGIPYRCLVAADVDNLLIPCRGGSFSSLAASSVRISRTLMQLGQAAGLAAWIAIRHNVPLADVPIDQLQDELRNRHVQLHADIPSHIRDHTLHA